MQRCAACHAAPASAGRGGRMRLTRSPPAPRPAQVERAAATECLRLSQRSLVCAGSMRLATECSRLSQRSLVCAGSMPLLALPLATRGEAGSSNCKGQACAPHGPLSPPLGPPSTIASSSPPAHEMATNALGLANACLTPHPARAVVHLSSVVVWWWALAQAARCGTCARGDGPGASPQCLPPRKRL